MTNKGRGIAMSQVDSIADGPVPAASGVVTARSAPAPAASAPPATMSVETEISPPGVASALFWMLPGPSAFLDRLAGLLNGHRAVAIHLSERTVLGHNGLIDHALARCHFDSGPGAGPVMLRVHDASQIDCDVAQHLCASDGQRQIGGVRLADWHTRARRAENAPASPSTFVLRPRGEEALQSAWTYLQEFVEALPGSHGNTRLILVRIDNEPGWSDADLVALRATGQFQAVFYDGALGPDEMRAYLGMRLAIGGTGAAELGPSRLFEFPKRRLARSLIAEYAGFDAHFAEALMRMSEPELMALPESLGILATRLPVSDAVWRQTSEKAGTVIEIDGEYVVHTLHEWHLACHTGPLQETAKRDLARKKWRAYLSALMPWFEEMRHELISELRSLLLAHLAPTQGQRVRVDGRNGREFRTAVDDLECGDIAQMMKETPPLRGQTSRERTALNLCHKVSKVRNEIAHLRPPKADEIQTLIAALIDHRQEIAEAASP